MSLPDLNRRERKSQRTRRQIVLAACELVLLDGYERATIARIAERADLATRTVTTRFPSKEAIFFEGASEALASIEQFLSGADGDVVDRLETWIDSLVAEGSPDDAEMRLVRSRAIAHDPDLRALFAQHFDRGHNAIAATVAADTGGSPEDVGPQMFAASAITMIRVVERVAAEQGEAALTDLAYGFKVLRGALRVLAS